MLEFVPKSQSRILVVDDHESVLTLLKDCLEEENYFVETAQDGEEALGKISTRTPDLVIVDMMMPKMNGYELSKVLKGNRETRLIPIIMLTGLYDFDAKIKAIDIGVDDFLGKPFNRTELITRVRSLLKTKYFTDQLENAETVIFSLARAVEARDEYTEGHCDRLAFYGRLLAERIGLSAEEVEIVIRGGILHDIGKIAISDAILLKPGRLTADEYEVMKTHPEEGEKICAPLKTLQPVLACIRHHQERWDGSGYPDKLKGEEIPLVARVVSTVDFYDALTTDRPYRKALDRKTTFDIMLKETQQGTWDPRLIQELLDLIVEKNLDNQG
ncbi:MAG: response regulator [Bacteroidetes bacterium]|nr:response regulator [Bacteroidota bacterium]